MKLEEIYEPIRNQLRMVNEELKSKLNSENELVRQINKYILDMPGKYLRPALVLLSARTGNYRGDKDIPVAAAVEIIHTATLFHDDVVDSANLRRGQPTVNSKWGNGIAVVLGDHWYSRAFSILTDIKTPKILEMLLEVINKICVGELEQLKRRYDLSFTEQEYLEIVENKTACLMSFCCRAGAWIGEISPGQTKSLANYGLNLGVAFQIVDDCLDFADTEEKTGKSLGSDLLEGKLTLPLIYAMNAANKKDVEWIKNSFELRQINNNDANRIKNMVKQSRAIDYSLKKAEEYRDISKDQLKSLGSSEYRDALNLFADYVIERGYQSLKGI